MKSFFVLHLFNEMGGMDDNNGHTVLFFNSIEEIQKESELWARNSPNVWQSAMEYRAENLEQVKKTFYSGRFCGAFKVA